MGGRGVLCNGETTEEPSDHIMTWSKWADLCPEELLSLLIETKIFLVFSALGMKKIDRFTTLTAIQGFTDLFQERSYIWKSSYNQSRSDYTFNNPLLFSKSHPPLQRTKRKVNLGVSASGSTSPCSSPGVELPLVSLPVQNRANTAGLAATLRSQCSHVGP